MLLYNVQYLRARVILNGGDKSSQDKDIKQAKLIFETLKGFGEV